MTVFCMEKELSSFALKLLLAPVFLQQSFLYIGERAGIVEEGFFKLHFYLLFFFSEAIEMKNFAAEIKMKCSELTTYILLLLLPRSSFSQDFILITAPL